MHGLLSLWTRTSAFRLRRDRMLVATLAINYAANVFDTLEYITDNYGMYLAVTLGWPGRFNKVSKSLEAIEKPATMHIWALGKLHAMLEQEKPFCQFDLDVLIRNPLPVKLTESPMFAQSIDYPGYYASEDIAKGIRITGLPEGGTAYNAGIIGGSNLIAVHEYARLGIDLAQKLIGSGVNGTAASMVIEQYSLGIFAHSMRVRLRTLFPPEATDEEIQKAGYTHLHGQSKTDPRYTSRVEAALEREFPIAYESFRLGWNQLQLECTTD